MQKKILIADDSPEVSHFMALALKNQDFDIHVARDGLQAVQMVRRLHPDLILLDILLPRQDGLNVCRLLKFDSSYRNIPIVIMTSMDAAHAEEQAYRAGADLFVSKPFDVTELVQKIKDILAKGATR